MKPPRRIERLLEPAVCDLIDEDMGDLVSEDGDGLALLRIGLFLVLCRQGHAYLFPVGLTGIVGGERAREIDRDEIVAMIVGQLEEVGDGVEEGIGLCHDSLHAALRLVTKEEAEVPRLFCHDLVFTVRRGGVAGLLGLGARGFDPFIPRDRHEDSDPHHDNENDGETSRKFSPPGFPHPA